MRRHVRHETQSWPIAVST